MLDLIFKVAQAKPSIWFSNLLSDYRICFVNRFRLFSLFNKVNAKKFPITFLFQTKMLEKCNNLQLQICKLVNYYVMQTSIYWNIGSCNKCNIQKNSWTWSWIMDSVWSYELSSSNSRRGTKVSQQEQWPHLRDSDFIWHEF